MTIRTLLVIKSDTEKTPVQVSADALGEVKVRELIATHGAGKVLIESKEGAGDWRVIELPEQAPAAPTKESGGPESEGSASGAPAPQAE